MIQKITYSLEGSSQPQQRMRKLPISINTSNVMLQPTPSFGKQKLIKTPITANILDRLSGALSFSQNKIVVKFGKQKHSLICKYCTNQGCISITSIKHDSDSDSDSDDHLHLEFQCTICRTTQSLAYMHQELGITNKKFKTIAPVPAPSLSTPLPGTPASMVSPQDIAYSEKYM